MRTKQSVAASLGVSGAAVSQYESGATTPRGDLIPRLAAELDVLPEFFAAGRPYENLDVSKTFFRSLRSTTSKQRFRSTAYTEQYWELVAAIEKHVRLPEVALPGFGGGEIAEDAFPHDPVTAAQFLRRHWQINPGPVPHMVRLLESKGIVVVIVPNSDEEVAKIDAFSTLAFTRPVIVLSLHKADDVYRLRFTAAHELGHLVLHGGFASGDPILEREADRFAAEFLTPDLEIRSELPRRTDFTALGKLSRRWGVSVKSLLYRSQEIGYISEPTARRGYMRLNQLAAAGVFSPESVSQHPGEMPSMLNQAIELAAQRGVTITSLADELKWKPAHLRHMLGVPDERPVLRLVTSTERERR